MLDRPQLAGAIKAHLDFIDDQQNAVRIEHAFQLDEEVPRWNDIAARALDRLHVKSGVLGFTDLRIPNAVVFALEQACELLDAVSSVLLLAHALGAAEMVGERYEVRAVAEVAIAAAVAIGRGDGGGTERATVIAALEGEHQALAALEVAHQLEAVFDRLAATNVEMHAALAAEFLLGVAGDDGRQLDLFAVQILACNLRQPLKLLAHGGVEALVAITEVDRRVPHLQVEVFFALRVVEEGAVGPLEDLRRIGVVYGVAVRTIGSLEGEQLALGEPLLRYGLGAARRPADHLLHRHLLMSGVNHRRAASRRPA